MINITIFQCVLLFTGLKRNFKSFLFIDCKLLLKSNSLFNKCYNIVLTLGSAGSEQIRGLQLENTMNFIFLQIPLNHSAFTLYFTTSELYLLCQKLRHA